MPEDSVSMLNPTMVSYLKAYFFPANLPGTEASGYNFIENRPQVDNNNAYQVRLDFHVSDKNFGFGRISQMWVYDSQPVAGTISSRTTMPITSAADSRTCLRRTCCWIFGAALC